MTPTRGSCARYSSTVTSSRHRPIYVAGPQQVWSSRLLRSYGPKTRIGISKVAVQRPDWASFVGFDSPRQQPIGRSARHPSRIMGRRVGSPGEPTPWPPPSPGYPGGTGGTGAGSNTRVARRLAKPNNHSRHQQLNRYHPRRSRPATRGDLGDRYLAAKNRVIHYSIRACSANPKMPLRAQTRRSALVVGIGNHPHGLYLPHRQRLAGWRLT